MLTVSALLLVFSIMDDVIDTNFRLERSLKTNADQSLHIAKRKLCSHRY